MTTMKPAQKAAKKSSGFTAEERSAVRDRARELKGEGEGETAVLEKIGQMSEPDRAMAKRVHAIIKASGAALSPKLWYGMPAYAKDDKIVCHFQPALKFKTRYASLGFSDKANLDDGDIWPVAYALNELTAAAEAKISALVKKAAS